MLGELIIGIGTVLLVAAAVGIFVLPLIGWVLSVAGVFRRPDNNRLGPM